MKKFITSFGVHCAALAALLFILLCSAQKADALILYQEQISNSFSVEGFLPDTFQYTWGYTTGGQFVADFTSADAGTQFALLAGTTFDDLSALLTDGSEQDMQRVFSTPIINFGTGSLAESIFLQPDSSVVVNPDYQGYLIEQFVLDLITLNYDFDAGENSSFLEFAVNFSVSGRTAPVIPEPATFTLLAVGFLGAAFRRR